jgi:hypothetical protein
MILTIRMFGIELLHLELAAPDTEYDDGSGYTSSTPVGFTANWDVPDFLPGPDRDNGWGDEGNNQA